MMTTVTTMTTVITAIYRNDDNNDDCSQTADSIHNEIGVDYSTREANTSGQTRAPIEQLRCSTDTSGKTGLAIRRRRTCARLKPVHCSMDTSGKTGMAIRKGRGHLTAQPLSSLRYLCPIGKNSVMLEHLTFLTFSQETVQAFHSPNLPTTAFFSGPP